MLLAVYIYSNLKCLLKTEVFILIHPPRTIQPCQGNNSFSATTMTLYQIILID